MKKLSVLFIALMSCLISCDGQTPTPPEKTAIDFGMSMGIGWNLGNQLDAHINGVSCCGIFCSPQKGCEAKGKVCSNLSSPGRVPGICHV